MLNIKNVLGTFFLGGAVVLGSLSCAATQRNESNNYTAKVYSAGLDNKYICEGKIFREDGAKQVHVIESGREYPLGSKSEIFWRTKNCVDVENCEGDLEMERLPEKVVRYLVQKTPGIRFYWDLNSDGSVNPECNSKDYVDHMDKINRVYKLVNRCETRLEEIFDEDF